MDVEFTKRCLPRNLLEWVSKTKQINLKTDVESRKQPMLKAYLLVVLGFTTVDGS